MYDAIVENHGSIFLLRPLNAEAKEWLETHVVSDAQWFGGAVVVEPRYINPILVGMQSEGLIVN